MKFGAVSQKLEKKIKINNEYESNRIRIRIYNYEFVIKKYLVSLTFL
jgi:hypothetical protein